jgi:hypothetical protein
MKITADLSVLRRTTWSQHAIRFAFGGATTVLAGLIARHWGPVIGGLFLAFPAIFPASATLAERHQREQQMRAGVRPDTRGRQVVALDAAGAAMGTVGLMVFALTVWQALPRVGAACVLVGAAIAWFGVSVAVWRACEAT